jgi:uncharacterized membrane protein YqaE (UPF0057 family)
MRLIIAIFLPFLSFFFIGKSVQGIICLILQLTLIGWIPAAIWAVYALSQHNTDKNIGSVRDNRNLGLSWGLCARVGLADINKTV